jgi:phosphatidylglycerophosphate synthase
MICVCVVLAEPILMNEFSINTHYIPSYVSVAAMVVLTIYSGVQYFIGYWPAIKQE